MRLLASENVASGREAIKSLGVRVSIDAVKHCPMLLIPLGGAGRSLIGRANARRELKSEKKVNALATSSLLRRYFYS